MSKVGTAPWWVAAAGGSVLQKGEDEPSVLDNNYNIIAAATKGLDRLMDITFGVARFPLKIGFALSFILLVLFLYLIW